MCKLSNINIWSQKRKKSRRDTISCIFMDSMHATNFPNRAQSAHALEFVCQWGLDSALFIVLITQFITATPELEHAATEWALELKGSLRYIVNLIP